MTARPQLAMPSACLNPFPGSGPEEFKRPTSGYICQCVRPPKVQSKFSEDTTTSTQTAIMFTVYPSAVVLLCLQLATATPVLPRQFTPTSSSPPSVTNSVSACATEAFQVSHFSISNIQGTGPKTISFFVSNPNLQLPEQVFCSYTFPNGTNSSAITSFNSYSCDVSVLPCHDLHINSH